MADPETRPVGSSPPLRPALIFAVLLTASALACATSSPLSSAALSGDVAAATALLDAGAEANERDAKGNGPLYYAAQAGQVELVELLLARGADVDADNSFGSTPIHVAARYGHATVIRVLARNRANVDHRNFARPDLIDGNYGSAGQTPLERAAGRGNFDAVRALVEVGAQLPANGALQAASRGGHSDIARYLVESTRSRAGLSGGPATVYTTDTPTYSRRIAAVLGVSNYAAHPNLEGARRDAKRMAETLDALGFDEIIELYDSQATRSGVLDLLGQQLPQKAQRDDLVFIFFAGHGQTETLPDGSKRGYILPSDASADIHASAISMDELRELSDRLPSKHVYYAIDSCYSGTALDRSRGPMPGKASGRAVQMITAGSEGQQAIERGGQGLFTTYLVRALEGDADVNADGVVTGAEIGAFVSDQVSRNSQGRQTPQFGNLDGTGNVALGAPASK